MIMASKKVKKASVWITAIVAILGAFGVVSPVGDKILEAVTILVETVNANEGE